jgi:hypothetical protein
MSYHVAKLFRDAFEQSRDFINATNMGNNINHQRKTLNTNKFIRKSGYRKIQEKGIMGVAIPKLCQMYILRYERAVLINSSTILFGNECVRLVNIAFRTSQIFPSMMGTYATISQYLKKELIRRHPNEHFHIIIGENDTFGFATNDSSHVAEIKQEQYRVLIFSTKRRRRESIDTHDANNQMKLQWESVVVKRM